MGDRSEHWMGYPTLPYPTLYPTLAYGVKVEDRGEVGCRSEHWVGTLPHEVQVGYSTVQEMKCGDGGGGGVGVNIGWGTLPWGGRSERWVGYPTLPYRVIVDFKL